MNERLPGLFARMTLVGWILLALLAMPAFAATSDNLPEPNTQAMRDAIAGVGHAGQAGDVTELATLETGERFARLRVGERELWVQLPADAAAPRVGERYELPRPTYLLRAPVAESADSADIDPNPTPDEELMRSQGGQSAHPLNARQVGVNGNCENFINSAAQFGGWGSFLMARINRSEHPNLFREDLGDIHGVCPKFHSFNDDQKRNFWVWLVAAMANFESSCKEKVTARGVNGTAAGLLQLHLGKEHNYGCRKGINSLHARDNLECGLVILNNDIGRTGRVFPGKNNYWQVLRPQSGPGKKTYRVALKYAPCH